jgi:O-acetylserine/cysteine efflux transporter
MSKNRIKAIATTLAILLCMSVGSILTKISFSTVSPYTFVYTTILIGMITLAIYTFVIRREKIPFEKISKNTWWLIFQIGFFNFVTGRLGVLAFAYLPVTTKTYISNFVGFLTMAMSCIILKELPTFYQILGAVIAFSGLRVFFNTPPQGGEWIGILMVIGSIFSIAYTNNIARKVAVDTNNQISNLIISTLAMLMGGSLMVITCIFIDGFPPKISTGFDWVVIIYTGVVTSALGLTVWNSILRTLRSYEASILGATSIIWTSILAVLILNEHLGKNQIIGIAMMMVGIVLVQVRKKFPLFKKEKIENANLMLESIENE